MLRSSLIPRLLFSLLLFASPAFADGIRLATGVEEGNYAQIGEDLAAVMAQATGEPVEVIHSGGSLDNIHLIQRGEADFALCQLDVTTSMADVFHSLRLVSSLYLEPMQVLVRKDAGIDVPGDLRGKRIDIGPDGSGTTSLALRVLRRMDIEPAVDVTVSQSAPAEALRLLRAGELDAMVFTSAYPAALFAELGPEAGEEVRLLSWPQAALDQVQQTNVFSFWFLPGRYRWESQEQVEMPAAICMLVVRSTVPEETVRQVALALHTSWHDLALRNPGWSLSNGLFAQDDIYLPLRDLHHPGAVVFHDRRREVSDALLGAARAMLSDDHQSGVRSLQELQSRWPEMGARQRYMHSTFLCMGLVLSEQLGAACEEGARLRAELPAAFTSLAELSNGPEEPLQAAIQVVNLYTAKGGSYLYAHNASDEQIRIKLADSSFDVSYGWRTASSSVGSLETNGSPALPGAVGEAPAGWLVLPPGGGAVLRSGSGSDVLLFPDVVCLLAHAAYRHGRPPDWLRFVRDDYDQTLVRLRLTSPEVQWGDRRLTDVVLVDFDADR
jgi:TRAP transporter TAXI family solute receptor